MTCGVFVFNLYLYIAYLLVLFPPCVVGPTAQSTLPLSMFLHVLFYPSNFSLAPEPFHLCRSVFFFISVFLYWLFAWPLLLFLDVLCQVTVTLKETDVVGVLFQTLRMAACGSDSKHKMPPDLMACLQSIIQERVSL